MISEIKDLARRMGDFYQCPVKITINVWDFFNEERDQPYEWALWIDKGHVLLHFVSLEEIREWFNDQESKNGRI